MEINIEKCFILTLVLFLFQSCGETLNPKIELDSKLNSRTDTVIFSKEIEYNKIANSLEEIESTITSEGRLYSYKKDSIEFYINSNHIEGSIYQMKNIVFNGDTFSLGCGERVFKNLYLFTEGMNIYHISFNKKQYLVFYTNFYPCNSYNCREICFNIFCIHKRDSISHYSLNSIDGKYFNFNDFNSDNILDFMYSKFPGFSQDKEDVQYYKTGCFLTEKNGFKNNGNHNLLFYDSLYYLDTIHKINLLPITENN